MSEGSNLARAKFITLRQRECVPNWFPIDSASQIFGDRPGPNSYIAFLSSPFSASHLIISCPSLSLSQSVFLLPSFLPSSHTLSFLSDRIVPPNEHPTALKLGRGGTRRGPLTSSGRRLPLEHCRGASNLGIVFTVISQLPSGQPKWLSFGFRPKVLV